MDEVDPPVYCRSTFWLEIRLFIVLMQFVLDAALFFSGGSNHLQQFTLDVLYLFLFGCNLCHDGQICHDGPFDVPMLNAFPRRGPTP